MRRWVGRVAAVVIGVAAGYILYDVVHALFVYIDVHALTHR